jgi:hypothetical protein
MDLLLILLLVLNVIQCIWLVAMAGERRALDEHIFWLQQQIEQLQRGRSMELDGGKSSGLLIVIVFVMIIVVVLALVLRSGQ